LIPLEYAVIFAFCVPIGFLINIPFYIHWLKRQKPHNEVYLYMVRGKFTYLNVLDMVARIERATKQDLRLERIKIERYFERSQKRKKSFKIYRSMVYRLLKEKSFGKPKILNSIRRMSSYTKVVAIWDLMIILSILNCIVISAYSEGVPFLGAVLIALLFGIFLAGPVWIICHLVLNHALKYSTNKRIKKVDSVPFRIVMAQFWAFTGGYLWKDIYWVEGVSSWAVGSYGGYYGGISSGLGGFGGGGGFGGFGGGGFGGGGAGGSW
tara:strand:+ start:82 stop:879 length:798 start_codon:yes stop_codon:yes gene_type:complete